MNTEQMLEKLKSELSEKRYIHSIGVCDEAVRMAKLFGADEEKAYLAGLLHDCAKYPSPIKEENKLIEYKPEIDPLTLICRPVLHAPLGAAVAEAEYGISDREILNAIRFHTTAREDMSLLEKIIYVADMTEPSRDFEGVATLRELSEIDIDKAFTEALRQSLIFNLKKKTIIHTDTLKAWNWMCINNRRENI
jgi:predicted HD superfamily hydrolase involved in NAD metabolism